MGDGAKRRGLGARAWTVAVLLGILGGVGAYTLHEGEGLSYLSSDPQACVNCHIMQPQFDSWQKASHHGVAVCVDCHLPHDFLGKYVAKADNGYRHSKAFTFGDFHEPIVLVQRNSEILQENCLHCHHDLVEHLLPPNSDPAQELSCVHCHRSVGHGETFGIGGPFRDAEVDLSERTR